MGVAGCHDTPPPPLFFTVLIVHPTERISTLGNSVNFTCVASRITDLSSVRWRINGLQVREGKGGAGGKHAPPYI